MYLDSTTNVVDEEPVEVSNTSIFDELVEKLGHDPLDRMHSSYDELRLATQYYAEAKAKLEKLSTVSLQ